MVVGKRRSKSGRWEEGGSCSAVDAQLSRSTSLICRRLLRHEVPRYLRRRNGGTYLHLDILIRVRLRTGMYEACISNSARPSSFSLARLRLRLRFCSLARERPCPPTGAHRTRTRPAAAKRRSRLLSPLLTSFLNLFTAWLAAQQFPSPPPASHQVPTPPTGRRGCRDTVTSRPAFRSSYCNGHTPCTGDSNIFRIDSAHQTQMQMQR
jgi:hypothetical protein